MIVDLQQLKQLMVQNGTTDYRERRVNEGNQSGNGVEFGVSWPPCFGCGTRSGTSTRRKLEDAGISAFRARAFRARVHDEAECQMSIAEFMADTRERDDIVE